MRFFGIFFLSIMLVSCSAGVTPVQNGGEASPPSVQKGYPVAATYSPPDQSYPAPKGTGNGGSNPLGPTVDPTLGSVKGKLLDNGKPVAGVDLYLAEPVMGSAGTEIATSIDRASSPSAKTNDEGEFVFTNVLPGNYGLVLDLVLENYLLLNPKNGAQFRFEVLKGNETNLGILDYDELPATP